MYTQTKKRLEYIKSLYNNAKTDIAFYKFVILAIELLKNKEKNKTKMRDILDHNFNSTPL